MKKPPWWTITKRNPCFSRLPTTSARYRETGNRRKKKIGYETEEEALLVCAWMTNKHGQEYFPYICPECGLYHNGRKSSVLDFRLRNVRPHDIEMEIELGERVCAYWYGSIPLKKSFAAAERHRRLAS